MLKSHNLNNGARDNLVVRQLLLRLEAVWLILLARILLKYLPFSYISAMFGREPRRCPPSTPRRAEIRDQVRQAIFQVWKRFPSTNTCFHRALAAHWMLLRRGISTQLYYGASNIPPRGLIGHVWLMDGDAGIVGMEAARRLPVLARFPPPPGDSF